MLHGRREAPMLPTRPSSWLAPQSLSRKVTVPRVSHVDGGHSAVNTHLFVTSHHAASPGTCCSTSCKNRWLRVPATTFVITRSCARSDKPAQPQQAARALLWCSGEKSSTARRDAGGADLFPSNDRHRPCPFAPGLRSVYCIRAPLRDKRTERPGRPTFCSSAAAGVSVIKEARIRLRRDLPRSAADGWT